MARIMKVRTIPRGYVGSEDLGDFVHENNGKNPAEWFMHLYSKFGSPQEGGLWSYMLRHNNVVLKVTATDSDTMDYAVWIAPGFVLDAKRKKTKAVNIIARRLNEKKVAFVPEKGDALYYGVRQKNDILMKKDSTEALRIRMDESLTDREKEVVYGSLTQYMDDAKTELLNTMAEIFE